LHFILGAAAALVGAPHGPRPATPPAKFVFLSAGVRRSVIGSITGRSFSFRSRGQRTSQLRVDGRPLDLDECAAGPFALAAQVAADPCDRGRSPATARQTVADGAGRVALREKRYKCVDVERHGEADMSGDDRTWRVGILFSRTGVSCVNETEHFFGTALAIEEINAAGGVLGRLIEPICYDPGGDSEAYRRLARRMLADDGVDTIFGCSLSASRKAVLPIVERHNGLLWYPSIYEGFEYSENVLYTGATLNQNTFALADFLLCEYGSRIAIIGCDYVYPRESNRVMRDIVESKGGEIVGEFYVPLLASDEALKDLVGKIERLAPDAVFSTVVVNCAERLYGFYADAGIDRRRRPIASLTMAEDQIRVIGAERCAGHILAAPYFQSLEGEANRHFVTAYKARFGADRPANMWAESAYSQTHLFARALGEAGTLEPHRLAQAALAQSVEAPKGELTFDRENRHVWLTPGIGVARPDGQFDIAWRARNAVRPDPYLAATRFETVWLEDAQS
jgi:branched-chain amino acid transport system substrate-binding protein